MSRYGRAKYGRDKYGTYEISIVTDQPLSQITRYRIRTINSRKVYSRPIVNDSITFPTPRAILVRIKANNGDWVMHQTESLQGEKIKLRVRSVSSQSQSVWVESVVGTIKTV